VPGRCSGQWYFVSMINDLLSRNIVMQFLDLVKAHDEELRRGLCSLDGR
jgi:hypothetical protein